MTREEIVAAIQKATARIEEMRPRIERAPEAPLPSGEWRVRDVLSHLAARGNSVPMVKRRLARAAEGTPAQAPAPVDISAINAAQVSERADRSVGELLDEIEMGHATAIQEIAQLDDAYLAQTLTMGPSATEISVAELLVRGGVGHEGSHLDEVEAALKQAAM